MVVNEEGGIRFGVDKTVRNQEGAQFLVPGPRGLFEAINGFSKFAHMRG